MFCIILLWDHTQETCVSRLMLFVFHLPCPFQERVASVRGSCEFLAAVGFEEHLLAAQPDQAPEPHMILPPDRAKPEDLSQARDMLVSGCPVPLKLHRNPTVLKPSSRKLSDLALPASFFDRTGEELKSEQKAKSEDVDRQLTLRTKEMRDRDEAKATRKYKYSLIRVKFPNDFQLQGTFGSREQFSEVRKFLRKALAVDWAPFVLKDPKGCLIVDDWDSRSIADLNLAPAAMLSFEWDADVQREWKKAGQRPEYLKQELMRDAVE